MRTIIRLTKFCCLKPSFALKTHYKNIVVTHRLTFKKFSAFGIDPSTYLHICLEQEEEIEIPKEGIFRHQIW